MQWLQKQTDSTQASSTHVGIHITLTSKLTLKGWFCNLLRSVGHTCHAPVQMPPVHTPVIGAVASQRVPSVLLLQGKGPGGNAQHAPHCFRLKMTSGLWIMTCRRGLCCQQITVRGSAKGCRNHCASQQQSTCCSPLQSVTI